MTNEERRNGARNCFRPVKRVKCVRNEFRAPDEESSNKPASAARGERDDLDARAGFDRGPRVIARENRLAVQFHNDRFAGQAEAFQQPLDGGFLWQRMRRAV